MNQEPNDRHRLEPIELEFMRLILALPLLKPANDQGTNLRIERELLQFYQRYDTAEKNQIANLHKELHNLKKRWFPADNQIDTSVQSLLQSQFPWYSAWPVGDPLGESVAKPLMAKLFKEWQVEEDDSSMHNRQNELAKLFKYMPWRYSKTSNYSTI